MKPRHVTFAVLIATALLAQSAQAQVARKSCGEGAGVISGVILNSTTRVPVPSASVHVRGGPASVIRCFIQTTNGVFIFTGLPPGADTIIAAASGFRRHNPLILSPAPNDSQHVVVELVPGTLLDECRDSEACRDWLQLRAGELPEDERFELLVLQVGTVLVWQNFDHPFMAYICIPDSTPPRVFEALNARHSHLARSNDCALPGPREDLRRANRLQHVPTGKNAFRLTTRPEAAGRSPERAVHIIIYVAPLWGETWRCTFRKADADWRVEQCELTGVS